MNAFNAKLMAEDLFGLVESCDACNVVIGNWDTVGDMATLAPDGVRILCKKCVAELDSPAAVCDITP